MIKTYLEVEDIEKMEEAAAYLRDKLLVRLLFHLGCRVSEALGIAVAAGAELEREVSVELPGVGRTTTFVVFHVKPAP